MAKKRLPKATQDHADSTQASATESIVRAESIEIEGVDITPEQLTGDAAFFWNESVPEIVGTVQVRLIDVPNLIGLAEWWGRYVRASKALDKTDFNDKNAFRRSMLVASAWKQFSKLSGLFGQTPKSRRSMGPALKMFGSNSYIESRRR